MLADKTILFQTWFRVKITLF